MLIPAIYILSTLALYMLDLFQLWEVIITAVSLFPLYAYARRSKKLHNTFYVTKTLFLFIRVLFITTYYPMQNTVTYPISMDTTLVLQMAGLVAIAETMVWYMIIITVSYATVKDDIKKCNDDVSLRKCKSNIWMDNLTFTYMCISIGILLVYYVSYELTQFRGNIIIFILCVTVFRLVYYVACKDTYKCKMKEFADAYSEKISNYPIRPTLVDLKACDEVPDFDELE